MIDLKQINWWKFGGIIAIAIMLFFLGFYIGKKRTKVIEKTIIEYVQGETIHDTIPPIIIKQKIPADTADIIKQCVADGIYKELFPEKIVYITDTTQFTKPDTTAILRDWATKREYEATLFDVDTLGKCKIKASVQYNRLDKDGIVYDYTPIQKNITNQVEIKKHLTPFVGAGITTFPSANIEAGLFIDESWGFALSGSYFINIKQIEGMPKFDVGVKVIKEF